MSSYQQQVYPSISLRLRSDLHLLRKAWHIGTGSLGLCLYLYFEIEALSMGIGLLLFALTGLILENIRIRNEKLNGNVLRLLGPFMRECERSKISGMPFYALGVSLALLLFEEQLALLAISFLIFADPISSLVGILLGKDKILPNKSLQGAMAGFCVCYIISMGHGLFNGVNELSLLYFSIAAGTIGAISEIISAFGIDDNLSIPVFSGFGLTLLNLLFGLF